MQTSTALLKCEAPVNITTRRNPETIQQQMYIEYNAFDGSIPREMRLSWQKNPIPIPTIMKVNEWNPLNARFIYEVSVKSFNFRIKMKAPSFTEKIANPTQKNVLWKAHFPIKRKNATTQMEIRTNKEFLCFRKKKCLKMLEIFEFFRYTWQVATSLG